MKNGMPAIIAIVVLALAAIIILKVLGALISLAVKIVLLAVAVGAALLIYTVVRKQIGGPGAR